MLRRAAQQIGDGSKPLAGQNVAEPGVANPLNCSYAFGPGSINGDSKRVLDFFTTRQTSRLPRSPFDGDRLRLDDGLIGTTDVKVAPPQLKPMDLRPAS